MSESGLAVVDKAGGQTSHQVVARARRLAGTRRVGHAGTLDPMATGVLVLGIERATRLLGQLSLTDKTYTATIRLGADTVTDDAEGEVVTVRGAAGIEDAAVAAALPQFTGDIEQVPSSVSAIKVGGVRSYARVRAGQEVDLPPRPVRVDRFEVSDRRSLEVDGVTMVDLDVVVDCSTGTYIRALARDLGSALGCGGHLTALRRTRVGPFTLDEAQPLADATALVMVPMAQVARRCFPCFDLDADQARDVGYGRALPGVRLAADPTALLSPAGEFLALYRPGPAGAVPVAVFTG